jgi:hypothetical protein
MYSIMDVVVLFSYSIVPKKSVFFNRTASMCFTLFFAIFDLLVSLYKTTELVRTRIRAVVEAIGGKKNELSKTPKRE